MNEEMRPDRWLNLAAVWRLLGGTDEVNLVLQHENEQLASRFCLPDKTFITIPRPIQNALAHFRPTPLTPLRRYAKLIGFEGELLAKREDMTPSLSHKLSTAVPQVYFAMENGASEVVTRSGAGQWGLAVAIASSWLGIKCTVFVPQETLETKSDRCSLIEMLGGRVLPIEDFDGPEITEYVGGKHDRSFIDGCSSLTAAIFQTVAGMELQNQLRLYGNDPGAVISCGGGGTNFLGLSGPYLLPSRVGRVEVKLVLAEAERLGAQVEAVDCKMQRPGCFSALGLRYYGRQPFMSWLVKKGFVEAYTASEESVVTEIHDLYKTEGIFPAPESAHAFSVLRKLIRTRRDFQSLDTIVVGVSGSGLLDFTSSREFLRTYDSQFAAPTRG